MNSYGSWIATEINLHHDSFIKEAFNRLLAADEMKIFWDLNPSTPRHPIYTEYIDKYAHLPGYNYCHFTLEDNINVPKDRQEKIKAQYDVNSVWYKRDILGLRMIAEGLIYRQFADNPHMYITDNKIIPKGIINIGVDFGGDKSKNAFVATLINTQKETLTVLRSERYEPRTPETLYNQAIDFVKVIIMEYGKVDMIYADDAEQVLKRGLQARLIEEGLNVQVKNSIKNPIIDRIRAVNILFATNRILLTENTKSLQEALSEAVWDPDKFEDIRLDNGTSDIDTLDAFEYSFERFIRTLTGV